MKIPGLLTVALIIAAAGAACAQEVIRMMIRKQLPIVEGSINGMKAYFIIDTGASITVLNVDVAKKYHFIAVHNDFLNRYHITGLGGNCTILEVRNAELQFGRMKLEFINRACALDNISRRFEPQMKIAGIIGTDVLAFLGSQINFSDSTLILYHKRN